MDAEEGVLDTMDVEEGVLGATDVADDDFLCAKAWDEKRKKKKIALKSMRELRSDGMFATLLTTGTNGLREQEGREVSLRGRWPS
jgi:hypothetical protein